LPETLLEWYAYKTETMFLAKKIITAFLIPPGIFVLILFFTGLWLSFRKRLLSGLFIVLLSLMMWCLTIAPVSDLLLYPLESAYSIPSPPRGDVIVLLGGGAYDDVKDLSGTGAPSEEMMGRIVTVARLYRKLGVPVVVTGGSGFKGKKPEAPIVKRILSDLGLPPAKVIIEDESRDTLENALYTKKVLDARGLKKPILVTSAFHMKRSVRMFEKMGLGVVPFPANFKVRTNRVYYIEDFLPGDFRASATALKEYIGLLFYKIAY
jgi:uncharacterized SAM-binding protein YcdF (DUF218 family)